MGPSEDRSNKGQTNGQVGIQVNGILFKYFDLLGVWWLDIQEWVLDSNSLLSQGGEEACGSNIQQTGIWVLKYLKIV